MNLSHELAVALCEVVVDGNDVNALSGQAVQVGRQSRNEGLALAGFHLCDTSLMENDTADDLYGVMAYSYNSGGGLAAYRESVRQYLVKRFAGSQPVLQDTRLSLELLLAHGGILVREVEHSLLYRFNAPELLGGVGAEQRFE